jgi:hypothetical protein
MKNKVLHIKDFLSKEYFEKIINIINEITYNYDYHLSWKLRGASMKTKKIEPFWMCSLDKEKFFAEELFNLIKEKIYELTQEKISLKRVYINGQTHGQQGYMHPDDFFDSSRTLLIYCNKEWEKNWAGGTVFDFDFESEIFFPYPNSAIYFDATIFHHAQPTSKNFNDLRVTLAYKLEVETDDK